MSLYTVFCVIFVVSLTNVCLCSETGQMDLVLFDASTGTIFNLFSLVHTFIFFFFQGAICNDGSPAGFYWRAGSGSGASQYVIHLQVILFFFFLFGCGCRILILYVCF